MESLEKIYASPSDDSPSEDSQSEDEGEYEDEPPPRRVLTAAEIREFEAELDALSSHSSDPEGPEDPGDPRGKSIEEITAWCIQYERKQQMERIARQQAGIEGFCDAECMFVHALMLCLHAAIRAMAARARPSTPKTLERKRSKGYAPRLDDEEVIVIDETGARRRRFTA